MMPPSHGIYLNGEVDYDLLVAVNQSSLKPLIHKSPKHYLHRMQNRSVSTRSQFRGTAAHSAVLEPEKFASDYVVFGGPRRAGKVWDAFEEEHASKTILKADEYEAALAFQRAVLNDPVAGRYFAGAGDNEATMYWRDPLSGMDCKARADRITVVDGQPVIVDLKSTKDPSPKWFGRDAANYLYHLQAAFYSDGYELITQMLPRYVIVAAELSAPNDVVVYALDEETLAIGREEYRSALKKLAECREAESWPGLGGGMEHPLELPRWALPNEDDLEGMDLDWEKSA